MQIGATMSGLWGEKINNMTWTPKFSMYEERRGSPIGRRRKAKGWRICVKKEGRIHPQKEKKKKYEALLLMGRDGRREKLYYAKSGSKKVGRPGRR